jgi:hypothetical protein
VPLVSTSPDGEDQLWDPERIDQFGYAYRTSQRPGARVHETVSEEGLGIAYWRFNAPYGDQVGVEGDLPNDLKWEFGGAVFRAPTADPPINEYAIYGSLWVLLPNNDSIGPRVTAPFRGTAGGPNGGPILTLNGEDVDIFFLPRGVQPGDILVTGDIFSFSGHVGPPLNSQVAITVTSPTNVVRSFSGQASKVGWFYDPLENFFVDERGIWTVDVLVKHEDMIPSTGNPPMGFNVGKVLGAANVPGSAAGRYYFSVVEPGDPLLPVLSPPLGFLTWLTIPGPQRQITLTAVPITIPIPIGISDAEVNYTMRMPGFILDQGTLNPIGNSFTIVYDPLTLHQAYPNIDLKAKGANRVGLTDPVWVSFSLSGNQGGIPVDQIGVVFIDGEEVFVRSGEIPSYIFLPLTHK